MHPPATPPGQQSHMLSRASPLHVSSNPSTPSINSFFVTLFIFKHCTHDRFNLINLTNTPSDLKTVREFEEEMESALFRTGSGSITSSVFTGSPRFSGILRHGSFSGEFSPVEVNNCRRISRAISEPKKLSRLTSINAGSLILPEMLPEEEEELPDEDVIGCIGSLKFAEKCFDRINRIPAGGIASEAAQFPGSGDGFGSRRSSGGGNNNNNNNDDRSKIGAHYRKLLKLNPNDPLLLRNYGKFLHEVEGDTVKAEEYYSRAILASPEDGEHLSLYGRLIWDSHRDGERAQYYFDQAINVSPDDCMVMGSYAQFMWEAEEDEDIEEELGSMASIPVA